MGDVCGKSAGPLRGGALQNPLCGVWVSCAKAWLGFAFPLVPLKRSAVVGESSCSPTGAFFLPMLQALCAAEEVPASVAASPAPCCCHLW